MMKQPYELQSEFARRFAADGRLQGQREGYRSGFADGVREGLRLAFEGVVERPLFRMPPEDEAKRDYRDEGRKQGRLEGYRDGMMRGARDNAEKLLRKMLDVRFGEVPEWVSRKFAAAFDADVECWLERALGAPTLEDVFAD